MSENELYVVKEYKFDNPLIIETDSLIVVLKIVKIVIVIKLNMNV